MEELTNDDFKKFIRYFKDKIYEDEYHQTHKCYDTVRELSRSDTKEADSLIRNSFQKMYGLDWMVKCSKKLNNKPPKSTDALFINEDKNGNLKLHLIEFKFIGIRSHWDKMNNLWSDIRRKVHCEEFLEDYEKCFSDSFVNDFKTIKKDFHDPIEISLQLKPYETVFITLPELYDEYCMEEGLPRKDIKNYLANIDKYYWAFVGSYSQSEYNIKYKTNRYNNYNKRLEMTIFKKARAKPWQRFEKTLKKEILEQEVIY